MSPTSRVRKMFVPNDFREPPLLGWCVDNVFTPDEGAKYSPDTAGEFLELDDNDVATLRPPPGTTKDHE